MARAFPLRGRFRPTGLWRHPDFIKLWLGQTVSQFGSYIGGTALSLTAILMLAATPAQMGLLAALESAPVLVVGLLAGVWVDRLRRRPVLIVADASRALLLVSIPVAAVLGRLRIEQLYVVAALVGALSVLFDVANQAYLPVLVRREHLAEGNGKLVASDSVAEMGGPAVAGSLVQWLGGPAAILIDAVSFAFSASCLALIDTPEPAPSAPGHRRGIRRDVVAGLRLVLSHPLLRPLAGSVATFTFFGNFIGTLYTLYAIRTLGIPASVVGLLIAVGGVGAFVGALVAGRVVRRFGLGPTLCGTMLVGGALQLLNPLAHGPIIAAAGLLMTVQVLGDVAYAVHAINEVSLRQAVIPDHLLGRATASARFLTEGATPLGALLAGVLGGAIGPRPTLLLGACGIMLASLWLFFSPIRALRELPAPMVETDAVILQGADS